VRKGEAEQGKQVGKGWRNASGRFKRSTYHRLRIEDIREFALLALELKALSSRSNALFDLHKKRE